MSLQHLIKDSKGQVDLIKVLIMLNQYQEDPQQCPNLAIPNETSLAKMDLIWDFELYKAITYDYPERGGVDC